VLRFSRTELQTGITGIKAHQRLPCLDLHARVHQPLNDFPAEAETQLRLVARANFAAINVAAVGCG
jgi:hypothetical protein